jgi:polar amino acid transport system substrate-binding protein
MRRSLVGLVVLGVASLALTPAAIAERRPANPTLAQCQVTAHKQLHTAGRLTLATDNPVFAPWFVNDNPANQRGFEGALAYRIAKELDFAVAKVKWVTVHYVDSFTPGAKAFDFDINELSYSSARAKNVTFSSSYYNLNQAIVALKGRPIDSAHAPAQLKNYHYGAVAGSTSLAYVINKIKPTHAPIVYANLSLAVAALTKKKFDGLVIDTPTAYFTVHTTLSNSGGSIATIVGQFPAIGDLYYALVLQKGNPLTTCINVAIASAKSSGALNAIRAKWLVQYNSIRILQP